MNRCDPFDARRRCRGQRACHLDACRPDPGLTVPVDDVLEKQENGSSSVDERRELHLLAYRSFEPTPTTQRVVEQAQTPFDRSRSVNLTPRGPFLSIMNHGISPHTVKMGLLKPDFSALRRSLYVPVCSNEKVLSVAEVAELTVSRLS